MEARLGVLDLRQEVLYVVGLHKRYMGIRGHPGGRGKAYRKVRGKRTEKRGEEESYSGRNQEAEPVETGEGHPKTDQMELGKE